MEQVRDDFTATPAASPGHFGSKIALEQLDKL